MGFPWRNAGRSRRRPPPTAPHVLPTDRTSGLSRRRRRPPSSTGYPRVGCKRPPGSVDGASAGFHRISEAHHGGYGGGASALRRWSGAADVGTRRWAPAGRARLALGGRDATVWRGRGRDAGFDTVAVSSGGEAYGVRDETTLAVLWREREWQSTFGSL